MCLSLVIRSPTRFDRRRHHQRNLYKYAYNGKMSSLNQTILLLSKFEIYTLSFLYTPSLENFPLHFTQYPTIFIG